MEYNRPLFIFSQRAAVIDFLKGEVPEKLVKTLYEESTNYAFKVALK